MMMMMIIIIVTIIIIIVIIRYAQSDSFSVLFDDSLRNKRGPSPLRQQSTATVGVSVMQCLITLFNLAEISSIRSDNLWFAHWSIHCFYARAHTSLPGMCRASFCLCEILFYFLLHGKQDISTHNLPDSNKHLMTGHEGNSLFCFSGIFSRGKAERNI